MKRQCMTICASSHEAPCTAHGTRWMHVQALQPTSGQVEELRDHVLILGFGRVGQIIGQLLSERLIPFVAIDVNTERVQVWKLSLQGPDHLASAASRLNCLKLPTSCCCCCAGQLSHGHTAGWQTPGPAGVLRRCRLCGCTAQCGSPQGLLCCGHPRHPRGQLQARLSTT